VPDVRRFRHVDVVFCQLNVSDVWIRGAEGNIWGVGGGPKGLVHCPKYLGKISESIREGANYFEEHKLFTS
jgi:hypothetical protein